MLSEVISCFNSLINSLKKIQYLFNIPDLTNIILFLLCREWKKRRKEVIRKLMNVTVYTKEFTVFGSKIEYTLYSGVKLGLGCIVETNLASCSIKCTLEYRKREESASLVEKSSTTNKNSDPPLSQKPVMIIAFRIALAFYVWYGLGVRWLFVSRNCIKMQFLGVVSFKVQL